MALTLLSDVQAQAQTFWAPMFMKDLKEQSLLGALVNKEYQGSLQRLGDRVRVSQLNVAQGQLLTSGVNSDSFTSEQMVTQYVDIVANKVAMAAFEVESLVDLQTQMGAQESTIRDALLYGVQKQVNDYLFSLVAPSGAAPDHTVTGVTDFNASQVNIVRKLASQAKWGREKPFYLLVEPQFMSDLLNSVTLTSGDYGAADRPVIGGQMALQRFGFNIFEDNSDGMSSLSAAGPGGEDAALAFHPDFMHLVMQMEPTFNISNLHSQKKRGYLISVELVFGAVLGIDGAVKHITVTA